MFRTSSLQNLLRSSCLQDVIRDKVSLGKKSLEDLKTYYYHEKALRHTSMRPGHVSSYCYALLLYVCPHTAMCSPVHLGAIFGIAAVLMLKMTLRSSSSLLDNAIVCVCLRVSS